MDQFEAALIEQFGGYDTAERARDLLATLRQLSSVEMYTRRFREVLLLLGGENYLDAEMRHKYILGLKPWVQRLVKIQAPDSLDQAIRIAESIDRVRVPGADRAQNREDRNTGADFETVVETVFETYRPLAHHAAGIPQNNAAPLDSTPMDVDAIFSDPSAGRRKPLTDRERKYLYDNRGCFFCRKPNAGHTARTCPEKPENRRSRQ